MNLLQEESIEIIREAVATARNPVMMYSIGKDSSVMLHLARKAFFPAPPPFPLLQSQTDKRNQYRKRCAARICYLLAFGIACT
jgi:3'-phosphoadenosine 5'-phosphosulfate sulfotransferase (PAPS reductase)/FAD synthetase